MTLLNGATCTRLKHRWTWFFVCAGAGLVLTLCGLLVPAHIRALDIKLVEIAGRKSPTLISEGAAALERNQLGPAQQFLAAARRENDPQADRLGLAVGNFAMAHPQWLFWGGGVPGLERLFEGDAALRQRGPVPIVAFLIRLENREIVIEYLRSSMDPLVGELLRCRALTNTTFFPSASSAAGQAFDAAIALTGLLARERVLAPAFREMLLARAQEANRTSASQELELALMDLVSLGYRFNWTELATFIGGIEDAETLRRLAIQIRKAEDRLPILFSAVALSRQPAAVSAYLMEHDSTGLNDMALSLRYGAGAVKEVLRRNLPVHDGGWRQKIIRYNPFGAFFYLMLDYCWLTPWLAMALKWLFYLAGGFLFAAALHFARPALLVPERMLFVPGFSTAREFLFALGFLLVILLLSEPFLALDSQKVEYPIQLRIPLLGAAVPAGINQSPIMNQLSLLTLLLFFVLQALIYTACLVKLAEIRRQTAPARMKLRLLENEEHLFDAGLYLGFVGTIISLILVSLGVIKPSLMAAYSSTSFGIIFVSILKIFHVRPYRRQLIVESETTPS